MLEVAAGLLFIGVMWVSWQFLRAYGSLIKEGFKSTARRYGLGEESAPQLYSGLAEPAPPPFARPVREAAYPWVAVAAVAVAVAAGFGGLSHYAPVPTAVAPGHVEAKFASGLSVGFQVSDKDNVDHAIDQVKEQASPVSYLRLEDINLSDLSELESFTDLKSLNLDGTLVDNLEPIKHLERLTVLDLGNTPFYDADQLMYFQNLEWLDLKKTKVNDFTPLGNLVHLRALNLEGLEIDDLSPLSNLANLQRLDVSHTKISDLGPLDKLTKLEELKLGSTKVSDLEPLYGLLSLKTLDLSETSVDPDQVERLRQRLTEGGNSGLEIRVSPGWDAAKREPTS